MDLDLYLDLDLSLSLSPSINTLHPKLATFSGIPLLGPNKATKRDTNLARQPLFLSLGLLIRPASSYPHPSSSLPLPFILLPLAYYLILQTATKLGALSGSTFVCFVANGGSDWQLATHEANQH